MRKVDPIGLAKAILWEEAKGKLRALVAAEGAQQSELASISSDGFSYKKIETEIESFIKVFEANGFHE